ncbi:MAG: SUMF1/EgtB/PvdO family nonheme iron enzyme [Tannerellaceae bacterium]
MRKRILLVGVCSAFALSTIPMAAQQKKETKPAVEVTAEQVAAEQKGVESLVKALKDPAYFQSKLDAANALSSNVERSNTYASLYKEVSLVVRLQEQLKWLNTDALAQAVNDMKGKKGFDANSVDPKLKELKALISKGFNGIYKNEPSAIQSAQTALKLNRDVLLANPDIDVDKFISVRYNHGNRADKIMAGSLGVQPNNWSNQTSASRNGFKAEMIEISGLKSGDIKTQTLYKPEVEGAALTDLAPNWDGERILFTSLDSTRKWQVFEMGIDGKNVKQVTQVGEPDLEFFDAAYLPDGRIVAVSNIGYHGVPCVNGSDEVGNMVIYDPKTNYLRRLTFDQDANWNPIVLPNGKVMYTRWEYTDLTHYYSRIVMHMNPDGTEQKSLYGSGSMFPNSIFDMKPLPGQSNRFVGIISGHHGVVRSGRMIIFDPAKSRKEEKGMVQEIPFRNREIIPVVKDELVNGVWPQFIKPYPLSDETFLVTAKLSPNSLWGVYLVDVYDNMTLIAEAEGEGIIHSVPVKKRPTPAVIPDRIKPESKEATVFIQDIYEGEGLRGVPRGEVKALRVFAYEYAYQRTLSDHYMQGIQAGWDIKRLIGTVPVEEDGSVIFKIPANTPVSLQPLDENGQAIQWMRSWLTGMPGEVVSCVGCHEDQNTIPVPKRTIASTKKPSEIKIADGHIRPFTFALEVQPILDRACIACHDGSNTAMPNFKDTTSVGISDWSGTRYFGKSYLAFHPYVNRQGPEADMYVMAPYEYHASTSEIVRMLNRGHHNVKLTDKEWASLYTWIDLNAPYHSAFNANPINGFEQYSRRKELADKYNKAGVDWRKEIADYAAYLDKQEKPAPVKPEPAPQAKYKEVKQKGWPLSQDKIKEMLATEKETRKEIEVADGVKIAFVRVPAGKFVMGSNAGYADQAPAHKAQVKNGFWMSETELTNEQYNALVPDHDSRIYAQFWKDHTSPGYPANRPQQPVVRVSYQEAMDYCKKLSDKTGLNVTLPTEVQWEWACRAGSDTDFWFGERAMDFAKFDNLADVQLEKMAVTGIDPQPMSKDNPWFPYYNYIPKNDKIDDGNMLPVEAGNYQANAFGLVDMHGNLAEWTRSAYLPYPYTEKDQAGAAVDQVVARGGSWIDRAKDATSAVRRAFLPWQRVNNVGMRIIIED